MKETGLPKTDHFQKKVCKHCNFQNEQAILRQDSVGKKEEKKEQKERKKKGEKKTKKQKE